MTAKEFVKSRYPKAKAESHLSGQIKGLQKRYWLIRDGREYFYMASSDKSESNAWVKAKIRIQEQESQPQI